MESTQTTQGWGRNPGQLPLGHLLAQVSRMVGRRMRGRMEEMGLHRSQGLTLLLLWGNDGVPQSFLAQALDVAPATATATLQRMERDGWITRSRDGDDQRVLRVHLTGKARSLLGELKASLDALEGELASVLTRAEAETFRASLVKIHVHLGGGGEIR